MNPVDIMTKQKIYSIILMSMMEKRRILEMLKEVCIGTKSTNNIDGQISIEFK